MTYILRRKKLGKTSCEAIVANTKTDIKVYRNDAELPNDPDELCIRWGCTSTVTSKNVLNSAAAIHLVCDKITFRRTAKEYCPPTWFQFQEWLDDLTDEPDVIIRPRMHHQGRDFVHCDSVYGAEAVCYNLGEDNYYISNYIDKEKEFRVFVISGRVVCVAQKIPSDASQKAWNVFQGAKFVNVRWNDWPLKAIETSISAFMLSGLDFGGVDVMVDKEGKAYVLEINSAPSLTSPYRQACFIKAFDYINLKGKDMIPVSGGKGYQKYIHPAIEGDA